MSNSLPSLAREQIASHLGPSNRMRLSLASKTWQSSSLVTNEERRDGKYLHQLRKLLLEAADDVASHYGKGYWKKRIGEGRTRARQHGSITLRMFGSGDEHAVYVDYKGEVLFLVVVNNHAVDMLHHGASDGEKALVDSIFARFGHVTHRREPRGEY